jgi:hypothetical protein
MPAVLSTRLKAVNSTLRLWLEKPLVIWLAFAIVHLWLAWVGFNSPNTPFNDVSAVYRGWVENALQGHTVGIDEPWVYPILAMVPMLASMIFGADRFIFGWLLVVVITNAAVVAFLLTHVRPGYSGLVRRPYAVWWWLGFMCVLGPVAIGRIDVMTVAIAMVGLLLAESKPGGAGALLAVATWIKVWPAALILTVLVAIKRRLVALWAALITGVGIGLLGLIVGSGLNLFGFLGEQSSRGLQIEAPVSTPWLWIALARPDLALVGFNREILTFQVAGAGTETASVVMTPVMVIALAAIVVLGLWVNRTGTAASELLPALSLAVVTSLIVFNKVGSPQFILWLAVPIVVGLVSQGSRFVRPALIGLGIAALTQIIYPFWYDGIVLLDPFAITILTIRNLGLIGLLVLALMMVWRSRRTDLESGPHSDPASPAAVAAPDAGSAVSDSAASASTSHLQPEIHPPTKEEI